jgi:hypothetical protein
LYSLMRSGRSNVEPPATGRSNSCSTHHSDLPATTIC